MKDARVVDDSPPARLAVVSDVARYQASYQAALYCFSHGFARWSYIDNGAGVSPLICRTQKRFTVWSDVRHHWFWIWKTWSLGLICCFT